jgi:Flavin containing amine oxidoreductase
VAVIHPQIRVEFEAGASHIWHDDPYAGGAFALFDSGQQTLLHDEIVKPEGRIHFAGEHASLYHAWIQGAFESGLSAAIAVHQAPLRKTLRVSRTLRVCIFIPRQCRVSRSFEPAFAGGSLPRNAALAQAYRVISIGVRDPKSKCWLKTGSATSRTQQGHDSYTINVGAMVGID